MKGLKNDEGKLRWSLLPWRQLHEVVRVLEHGARKYSDFNWQSVERQRYIDAAFRHMIAYVEGEKTDPETGLSHLAHAITNLLFIMWHDDNG